MMKMHPGGLLVALMVGLCLTAPGSFAQAQDAPPVRVGTLTVTLQPINPGKEFVGRIEARERVELRARVTGFLQEVSFQDGQPVKEGDLLYRIEPAPFQAALSRAQGALEQARGQAAFADAQLSRAEDLLKTQAGSAATRDQRLAEQLTAKGNVQIAEANVQAAEIDLGYTEIRAPISGLIGRTNITRGNVVGPDRGVLTTIVSEDPMHVTVPVSQREFLTLRSADRVAAKDELAALIHFSDGSPYEHPGKIDFVDASVNRSTDSVTMRAVVPNPNGRLIDGQLVKVTLQLETPIEKILVPQSALIADQQGFYVFVVEDGKAAIRRVTLDDEIGTSVVVDSGLTVGDQIIVEGISTLRPGAPVSAQPATMLQPKAG
ncbi:efflux RND transporter periplasmic adaptor subunit [Kaistia dalseonensis]|uniref:Membrane fusion protein (Multidrug efflux system) n=1 Tax=Kaistia dalseonensis TaxID=410840 RepID=A0ABU0H0S0_9HYPH|nr:efflux RND transporter periplasmic adaptor subunit [Kaistia dalseonensis]MCX5493343.1 efflux RND transporter periplasmic adaptor subunit [Kaistia dalseonensis]MDQ0435900.1 membrane fusion protein (multidrug efflux system) [Kaistia dalseonensis]